MTALFRDPAVPNPLYMNRECYHISWFTPKTPARDQEGRAMYSCVCRHLERVRERAEKIKSIVGQGCKTHRGDKSALQSAAPYMRYVE